MNMDGMKQILLNFRWLCLAGVAACAVNVTAAETSTPNPVGAAPVAAVQSTDEFSTNITEVLKLSQAGMSEDVVIAFIKNSQVPYNLKARDILALKAAGLSQNLITTMIKHDSAMRVETVPGVYNPAVPAAVAAETSAAAAAPAAPVTAPAATTPAVVTTTVTPTVVVAPAPQVVVVQPPVPAPQIEVIPVCPAPGYYWYDGCWRWDGRVYVWSHGYWGPRPGPGVHVGVYFGGHRPGPWHHGPGPGHRPWR
jgi:hypothetical protein